MTAKQQVHDATDRVTEKIHQAIDKTASGIEHSEEFLRKEAALASEKLQDGAHRAQVKSCDVVNSVTGYVRDNPLTALGVAFVAGSVLAALLRRR